MSDIHKLASMLRELDDQLIACTRCGMCQAVCPVFGQTGRESDVTRGKLALLDGLAREILSDPEGVNEKLNRCLLCGTCQSNCPSGVKIMDIFFKARSIMTGYLGLSPVKQLIFRGILSKPGLFNTILEIGSKFQGLFTTPADIALGSSCTKFDAPLIRERHFKTLAAKPFHKSLPEYNTVPGRRGIKVAFYTGCIIDKIYLEVGHAVLKVLDANKVGVFMPPNQACCGIPALDSGDTKTFNKLLTQNAEQFRTEGFNYLVTACATCTSTIKELWPQYYSGSKALKKDIENLAEKTMDISQFLVDVIGLKPHTTKEAVSVTYHDPCHLKNSLSITAQPRELIKAAGCDFKEMEEAGICCGCGGSFNIAHYDLSAKIGRRKAENIRASGADIVATSCPACMMQITDMLSQNKVKTKVKHVIEIYAEQQF